MKTDNLTKRIIALIKEKSTLKENAVIEANLKKPLQQRANDLKEIILSLADEENTPWLSYSIVSIALEFVNWEFVITHFKETYSKCPECGKYAVAYSEITPCEYCGAFDD